MTHNADKAARALRLIKQTKLPMHITFVRGLSSEQVYDVLVIADALKLKHTKGEERARLAWQYLRLVWEDHQRSQTHVEASKMHTV